MTSILGVCVIYVYSMIAYFTPLQHSLIYNDNEEFQVCKNAKDCFLIFLDLGLRNGGGIGDVFFYPGRGQNQYIQRFLFDLSFFIIIIVVLLKVVFGIIIDSFSELRDKEKFNDWDQKNRCFICNIQKDIFENQSIKFNNHIQKQHNMWNYLYYIIHLKFKKNLDYDGTETYVQEKINVQDISWIPVGKSIKQNKINQNKKNVK
ncbi:inositol -triphosphate type 3, putative [Ichthyophthirius multifiliis]|uniref:Inositol-triphosphate type 3, putative n=1 Tax=Ichthyophthirius multifiliis TaxID=5932 RepID=G0QQT7_ICHMU|nr:inositol -triphosphate type 3, putative [Ichthyophthirius multifiliis]EGR32413.1 inositol -triphosphate type 3, putative [Ichthyophthirius multifiliis]|eukprot:XP_004036399.1 inositol -triphosphate type 3, putative [Ichthyophthirius multifiliis]